MSTMPPVLSALPTQPARVSLDDKYTQATGRVYLTGTQALVRLLLAQKARDEAAGLNTGGFVSGYRGSPLGGVDQEMWRAKKHLDAHHIRFTPGLNEELAATAVWGSQMVALDPQATVQGVFSLWYGKGPGVDRSGDVFKHGNIAGCAEHGGVLLVAGDDHACKSSTLPHQSEHAFIAAMIPVLHPSGVREFIEFGLHGYAMSRYSGCWVGFKTISDTVESSSSVDVDPMAVNIRIPDSYPVPPDGFHIRWPDPPLQQENRLQRERLYALLEYVRVNGLNRQDWAAPSAKLGICTTGKSYLDVREALVMLGLDEAAAAALGLRLLKIGVVWPLEPQCVVEFAQGLDEILVVEEKRQVLEYQIKEHLYNEPASARPRVVGKYDETGEWVKVPHDGILLSPNGELTPAVIASVIASRLAKVLGEAALPASVLAWLTPCHHHGAQAAAAAPGTAPLPQRVPYFCAGCPHNTSTKVPEGSQASAGIGCHYMVQWMDRRTATLTQMGGEGVSWIGHAPFTTQKHRFINLGDGTYMHSGSLAIRAARAAGVNVTYKLLVNDAVAMTGGQPVEGAPTPVQLLQQLAAEGITQLFLVSDEPAPYRGAAGVPAGVEILHRDAMDALQRRVRELQGVSVIVYVQTCAAEKRRRRKKGVMPDLARRAVIHTEVCEGCGDCGVQSNCVAITPVETPLGRKRAIDQSACNKDFSCVKGFCPSFVTVEGGQLRKPQPRAAGLPLDALPEPTLPVLDHTWNVLITGVGGTGVVTIGALLGMAAHLEGKGVVVLDMAGLAQKGGAVMSHVRIAANPDVLHAARVPDHQADVLLGCDLMVSASASALLGVDAQRTRAVLNTDVAPTGTFTQNPDWQASPDALLAQVRPAVQQAEALGATHLATALLGDAVATNVFVLGFAWQKGWLPLRLASLEWAIELNGAAVAMNRAAFAWGRLAALDVGKVIAAAGPTAGAAAGAVHEATILLPERTPALADILADRLPRLTAYQNAAYAQRYERFVQEIAALERERTGSDRFTREVAVSLYKLMAVKDEYEVARQLSSPEFLARIDAQFEGDYRLNFHLVPPWRGGREGAHALDEGADAARPGKQRFGPWLLPAMRWLAKGRVLRGTVLDVFGRSAERREERAALAEFEHLARQLAQGLTKANLGTALALAKLPQSVRGFGPVKAAAMRSAQQRREALWAQWQRGTGAQGAV